MLESNPHSHGVSGGIYGGNTLNWVNSAVYFWGPVGGEAIGINATDINHRHNTTISGQTGTVSAWHTHNTTISGATGYMNSANTHSHSFTGTLMTTASMGGDGAHNNMQPWTAWNIMIRL
jgi:microcystin-dependent protein